MTMLEVQRRLSALGFDPGPFDGVRGRRTIRAVKAFQARHRLTEDGIVGPLTAAALARAGRGSSLPLSQSSPARGEGLLPWYEEALRLKGTREAAGDADSPDILRWAKRLGLVYRHDSIAWCGLFVAHCVAASLPDEPLPNNPLGARNWLRFGTKVEPTLGAVLVFWRGSRSGALGHVGFYAAEDTAAFHVLGGNQSDCVSITRLAKVRLLGARWPVIASMPKGGSTGAEMNGSLSTNEA